MDGVELKALLVSYANVCWPPDALFNPLQPMQPMRDMRPMRPMRRVIPLLGLIQQTMVGCIQAAEQVGGSWMCFAVPSCSRSTMLPTSMISLGANSPWL